MKSYTGSCCRPWCLVAWTSSCLFAATGSVRFSTTFSWDRFVKVQCLFLLPLHVLQVAPPHDRLDRIPEFCEKEVNKGMRRLLVAHGPVSTTDTHHIHSTIPPFQHHSDSIPIGVHFSNCVPAALLARDTSETLCPLFGMVQGWAEDETCFFHTLNYLGSEMGRR